MPQITWGEEAAGGKKERKGRRCGGPECRIQKLPEKEKLPAAGT